MNWNYIAGFFDGEGTLGKYSKSGYKIGITQSSKKVLEEIQIFTGLGHIHFIKKRKSHWQNAWLYYIAKQEDVYFFLNKILDNLVVKKEVVLKVLPILKKNIENKRKRRAIYLKKKQLAKILRRKGLSYRQIGKRLDIDWGYARRLMLDLK